MNTKILLGYRNNWEADEYFDKVIEKEIKNLKEVDINGKLYKVKSRSISVPVYDMGHTYTATSKHYFVTEEVFGVKIEFDLNTIVEKVPVFATKATFHKD